MTDESCNCGCNTKPADATDECTCGCGTSGADQEPKEEVGA